MPLADILQAMEAEAAGEIRRIEDTAARAAAEIRMAADADARAIRSRHLDEVQLTLRRERARRLNAARLAALCCASQTREELFAEALRRARARLAGLRDCSCYPAILRALIEESWAQLDGELVLRIDPRDQAQLCDLPPGVRVETKLNEWGGAEAATPDRRIVVINTLAARLEHAHELLRRAIMPLFDDPADV